MIDPPDRSRRRRDRLEAGSRSHEEDVARSTQEPPRQTPGRPTPHLPCFDLVSHARPALVCEHELHTDNIFCQPPLDGRKRDVAIRFPGDPSTTSIGSVRLAGTIPASMRTSEPASASPTPMTGCPLSRVRAFLRREP